MKTLLTTECQLASPYEQFNYFTVYYTIISVLSNFTETATLVRLSPSYADNYPVLLHHVDKIFFFGEASEIMCFSLALLLISFL